MSSWVFQRPPDRTTLSDNLDTRVYDLHAGLFVSFAWLGLAIQNRKLSTWGAAKTPKTFSGGS